MKIANNWTDYKILDMSDGMKVESWNGVILTRPDPQIVWKSKQNEKVWEKSNAVYHRSKSGGGYWEYKKNIQDRWTVNYKDLTFNIKLMGFKHTGLFPEQAVNWDYMIDKIKNSKENIKSSNLEDRYVRFIVDDVIKFVKREIRRGNKYDVIIMDPPSFGRGANKEVWNIENDLYNLVELCSQILSDKPLFFLINSYTTGMSKTVLENILSLTVNKKFKGTITSDEIGLPMENSNLILPCGIYGRWESNE